MDVVAEVKNFLTKHDIGAYRRTLLHWYGPYGRDLPWRRDFRRTRDPYYVWVSEVMLQQTLISAVIPAYERFVVRFPSVQALAQASIDEVCQTCHGLGYYRRFRFMHEAARLLVGEQSDLAVCWPSSYEAWRAIKGIGPYSAAAIASITLGAPHAVVDGNVERIFCRLLDIRLPTKDSSLAAPFATLARGLLTQGETGRSQRPGDYNQALMELGQRLCSRVAPNCSACPLRDVCTAFARGSQHLAPAAPVRAKSCAVNVDLFIKCDSQGRIALVMRDDKARFLKQSLGFPWRISNSGDNEARRTGAHGGFRHTITHHRLDVLVHLADGRLPRGAIRWVPVHDVETLLVASLDRKAWRLVQPQLKNI